MTIAPEVGEVWAVGRHLWMCSDLMQDPHDTDFPSLLAYDQTPTPTLIYTDPPWGQGLANGFRTKAGLGRAEYHWTEIYQFIADLADHLEVPLYAEGPKVESPDGMQVPGSIRLRHRPRTERGYWPITYFGGKPSGLFYAATVPPPDLRPRSWEGWDVPDEVLAHYPQGVVVDPCSGLGGVPLRAEAAGWTCISNELNPDRMRVGMERMEKATGQTPVRLA